MQSHKLVQWACHKHEQPFTWIARIDSRTRKHMPSGCPECARAASRRPKQSEQPPCCSTGCVCGCGLITQLWGAGQPSLAEGAPEVAAQWHPDLNEGRSPQTVTCGSNTKAWWLCQGCPLLQACP